jgi:oligopeptide/dipeptide ABC transporter ATP-binding protein
MQEGELQRIRGNEIAMIFQEPMTSLNPVFTCGDQVMEAVTLHQKVGRDQARARALEMFKLVGIPDPERRLGEYPHQLSGGLRQRVMIAMALSCHPSLLICDEPTTALDVTIQAQILALLGRMQRELGMAIILITHDLGVIAQTARRVVVMYAGKVVETGDVRTIYHQPRHPYTIGLQQAIPRMGRHRQRLNQIEGVVPNPLEFPSGCKFHPRCPAAEARCSVDEPPLDGGVACWRVGKFDVNDLYRSSRRQAASVMSAK